MEQYIKKLQDMVCERVLTRGEEKELAERLELLPDDGARLAYLQRCMLQNRLAD